MSQQPGHPPVSAVDELKLKALPAISAQVALYTRRSFTIFHDTICGITVNTYDFNDCHKDK